MIFALSNVKFSFLNPLNGNMETELANLYARVEDLFTDGELCDVAPR